MLDFRLLTFLDLCHSGSYTKTAENLNMTQPAVSQHIKYLEHYYGTKLVLYQNRTLSLTNEGQYLFNEVSKLNVLSNTIRQNIHTLSVKNDMPSITIGSDPTIGEFMLPNLISAYTDGKPNCRIRSFIDPPAQLDVKLREGIIDFLITDCRELFPEMEHRPFCKVPICCACNPNHPLAGKTVSLARLKYEKITYRERSSHAYAVLLDSFSRLGYNLDNYDITFETGSMYSILQYLRADMSISFIYRCAVDDYLATGKLAEIYIKEKLEPIDFYCIYPQKKQLSEEAKDFLHFCLEKKKQ